MCSPAEAHVAENVQYNQCRSLTPSDPAALALPQTLLSIPLTDVEVAFRIIDRGEQMLIRCIHIECMFCTDAMPFRPACAAAHRCWPNPMPCIHLLPLPLTCRRQRRRVPRRVCAAAVRR